MLAHLAPVSFLRASWRRPEEPLEPRVRRLVAERFGLDAEDLAPEVSLINDLAADSLDVVDIALTLEGELGITFPESVIDELGTYGQVVEDFRPRPCSSLPYVFRPRWQSYEQS